MYFLVAARVPLGVSLESTVSVLIRAVPESDRPRSVGVESGVARRQGGGRSGKV